MHLFFPGRVTPKEFPHGQPTAAHLVFVKFRHLINNGVSCAVCLYISLQGSDRMMLIIPMFSATSNTQRTQRRKP
jgi:hypothetical protein